MGNLTEQERKQAGLKPYCPCGSGWHRQAEYDARGIFLCFVCTKCRSRKLRGYRPEVLTDPNYEADDLGDDE